MPVAFLVEGPNGHVPLRTVIWSTMVVFKRARDMNSNLHDSSSTFTCTSMQMLGLDAEPSCRTSDSACVSTPHLRSLAAPPTPLG